MAMSSRTLILGSLGLGVAAALAYVALRTDPVPVDLHRIERAALQVTVNADGKTRIRDIYEVAAPITGTVLRSPVRVGDPVVAGDTIVAVVEPASSNLLDARSRIQAEAAVREAEAALHQASSRMREAEEDLTLAEREYNRAKTLVERGVASITRLEIAEQQLGMKRAAETAAESGLEMSKSALDRARAALIEPTIAGDGNNSSCCMQLTAPVDGFVLDVDVMSERPVIAGTRLLSVGQPRDLEIVADILSTDAVRLGPGDRAMVDRWGGGAPLEARITRIEPSAYTKVSALGIEEQRVDILFDLVSDKADWDDLGDGYSVFLRIVEWERDDVPVVPVSALFRSGLDWAVFVGTTGAAEQRVVRIGRRNESFAQILDGLSEGDLVITHPSENIQDGTAIMDRGTQ